jgi:NAD(P)-dependent dehydrogenase (short-subunit alcohol dehydrogenase family)
MSKSVIVTGASRGIGRVIALELARRGYSLVLVARSAEGLASVRAEAEAEGVACTTCAVDVTSATAGAAVRDAATQAFGLPWGLVNNAGMARSAPLAKCDDEHLQVHLELNFMAPMRLMRALVPRMVEAKAGRVVNVLSTVALAGYPYVSAYGASKHALLGATRSLAQEFARKGVTFNAVCPGYVRTEMFDETLENIADKTGMNLSQAEDSLKQVSPQNRIFEPVEVARAVAFLLEEGAHGISGQALSIDGGEIAH